MICLAGDSKGSRRKRYASREIGPFAANRPEFRESGELITCCGDLFTCRERVAGNRDTGKSFSGNFLRPAKSHLNGRLREVANRARREQIRERTQEPGKTRLLKGLGDMAANFVFQAMLALQLDFYTHTFGLTRRRRPERFSSSSASAWRASIRSWA
jgi:hypothetical protein